MPKKPVPVTTPLRVSGSSETWPELHPIGEENIGLWRRRELWTLRETSFLLHGYAPHPQINPEQHPELAQTYEDLRRAVRARRLRQNTNGELWRDEVITWAADHYSRFPFVDPTGNVQTTEEFVERCNQAGYATQVAQLRLHVTHLSGACRAAEQQRDVYEAEVKRLTRELAAARKSGDARQTTEAGDVPVTGQGKATVKKLWAFVGHQFGFKIDAAKNDATSTIQQAMRRHNIEINETTIRERIKDAMAEYPGRSTNGR